MDLSTGTIKKNIEDIFGEIKVACDRVGRKPQEVKLVAVSKMFPVEVVQSAYETGLRVFGENKVQELTGKMPLLPQDIEWHLIGTLQKNKVKYVVGKVALIHSVDSAALLSEISRQAVKKGVIVPVLLQVNVAGEETKQGFDTEEILREIKDFSGIRGIKIKGLMTMAPIADDPEKVRYVFRELKSLSERIRNLALPGIEMGELSMGMSDDFKIAVEEGATVVRIGSRVFGARNY